MTKFTMMSDTTARSSTTVRGIVATEEESVRIQRDLAEKLLAFQHVAESNGRRAENSQISTLDTTAQQPPKTTQTMFDSSTEDDEEYDEELGDEEEGSESWRNARTKTKRSSIKKKVVVKGISKHSHVCVICKQTIPSHRCYQSHYYLEDYKIVFPQFDGSHGKVCPTCYYKCYTYRMNKQRAVENGGVVEPIPPKKRRERAASITKQTELERGKDEDIKRLKCQLEEKELLINFLKQELQITKSKLEQAASRGPAMHLPPIQFSPEQRPPPYYHTSRLRTDISTYH